MRTQEAHCVGRGDGADRYGTLARVIESRPFLARVGGAVAATVLLLVCLFGVASAGASQAFPTPESAITYFIEHVKAEDYDGALHACAVNEIATRYDYEALIQSVRALFPTLRYLPSEYGLFVANNRRAVEYQILQQLSWIALSVALPAEYEDFLQMRTLLDTAIDFDHIVGDMNPQKLFKIEIVEIEKSQLLESERHLEYLARQAQIYGADAATSRAVLYEIDGTYYVGGFQLLRYDGEWLISALTDILIDQPASGALLKVSGPAEFEAMLE